MIIICKQKIKEVKKINYSIGKNVRFFRELLNLTQENLGESVGLSPLYIDMIENGERNPSDNTLERLSYFFKIDKEDLLD